MSFALYIHVPYCLSRCGYCDFASTSDPTSVAPIVRSLESSLNALRSALPDTEATTIYIGGGTPTGLDAGLLRVTDAVRSWTGPSLSEFTVETNPDTTDPALIHSLVTAGVTRFSVGVQSFDAETLRTLGRRHDARTAHAAITTLLRSGARVSLDLIAGVPGQSQRSWMHDVEEAAHSGVGHVSVYPLTLSEDAPLYGSLRLDDDAAADRLEEAADILRAAGFERYEIASFARPGERSLHNSAYWTGVEYLGIGASASSMLSSVRFRQVDAALGRGHDIPAHAHRVRFMLEPNVRAWIEDPLAAPAEVEFLTRAEAVREDLMLALRTTDGATRELVDSATVLNPHLTEALSAMENSGLVEWVPDTSSHRKDVTQRLALSERGWLLGNEVFGRIWNLE